MQWIVVIEARGTDTAAKYGPFRSDRPADQFADRFNAHVERVFPPDAGEAPVAHVEACYPPKLRDAYKDWNVVSKTEAAAAYGSEDAG